MAGYYAFSPLGNISSTVTRHSLELMDNHSDNSSRAASSRLSSPASRSPSPPSEFAFSYPSPNSSQLSSLGSTPTPSPAMTPQRDSEDISPPAKRRKLEPKPRATEQLNLDSPDALGEAQKSRLDKLLKVLHKKRKIVVVAGAGISVSAGIPDFRSTTGLFKTLKSQHNLKFSGKDLFDASVYKDDKSTSSFHEMVRSLATVTKSASATPFHHLLATLAQQGRLLRLYTQNVDGIDTALDPLATEVPLGRKGPWPKTVQLHGSLEKMVCTKCHKISKLNPDLFDRPDPPPCLDCMETDGVRTLHAGKRSHGVGRLRPRMVLYNEHNPDDEAIGAVTKADMKTRPDALIVVGTTLKVPGVKRIVKEMCQLVRDRRNGMTVWINNDLPPPGKDYEWDIVVQGPCDAVASAAALPKWDDVCEEVTEAQLQKIKQVAATVQVIVPSPSKKKFVDRIQGHLTPLPSPKLGPQQADAQSFGKSMAANREWTSVATQKKKEKMVKPGQSGKVKKLAGTKSKRQMSGNAASKKPGPQPKINLKFGTSKYGATQGVSLDGKAKVQSSGRKAEVSQPMQPVSPSAARNNSNPAFITRVRQTKTQTDGETVCLSVVTPEPKEERHRIVSPTTVPTGMERLLN